MHKQPTNYYWYPVDHVTGRKNLTLLAWPTIGGVPITKEGCETCRRKKAWRGIDQWDWDENWNRICKCSRKDLFGDLQKGSITIKGLVNKVAIFNQNPGGSILTGGYRNLQAVRTGYCLGITVGCLCGLMEINKTNYLEDKNLYLKAINGNTLIPGGTCEITKILFLINIKSGKIPTLYSLSQLEIVKKWKNRKNFKKLCELGYLPECLLKDLPHMERDYMGFKHCTMKGKKYIVMATCLSENHLAMREEWPNHNRIDNIDY